MYVQTLVYFVIKVLLFIFFVTLHILITVNDLSVWFNNENIGNAFDFVIVGGGSAGAILAARLSENPNVTVLLVEAGGYAFDILNIPVLGPLKQLTDLDWQYTTVPQKFSSFGLINNLDNTATKPSKYNWTTSVKEVIENWAPSTQVSRWPSGRILGGSTHLNYMIYMEGDKNDYLTWKDPESSDWDLEDISFYFKKAFRCVRSLERNGGGGGGGGECKGGGGSILVRRNAAYTTELSEAVLLAASELNYSVNELNAETNTGFMKPQLNMNEFGRRWTSDQYLLGVKKRRKNLKILTNTVAKKVLLRNGFEAYAVEVSRNGRREIVPANLEVILSAGTVGSAKLLQLSGIGPADVLAKANVPQLIDLPVGRNLQDHITTGLDLVLLNKTLFSFADLLRPSAALRYFLRGNGPFASGLVDAVGLLRSPLAGAQEAPDLEFMVLVAGLSSDRGVFFRHSMGISEKVWDGYFGQLFNESAVSILPVLLHPKSVGALALDPEEPEGPPRIDPRYLAEEEDVRSLVEGIKLVRRLLETRGMRSLGARLNERKLPGCEALEFGTEAYWACYVRRLTLSAYHPVGTCRLGRGAEGGVVDHRLRVHGTSGLRVVDASVMPNLPSGNTNAVVVMIAEKGADLIKEDLINRRSSCRRSEILLRGNTCPTSDPRRSP